MLTEQPGATAEMMLPRCENRSRDVYRIGRWNLPFLPAARTLLIIRVFVRLDPIGTVLHCDIVDDTSVLSYVCSHPCLFLPIF